MKATVASLHCYPLKSARGVELTEAIIGARGFHLDRHWMLIDGERKGQPLRLVRLAPGYVRGVPDEGGRIALEMLKPCKRCGTPQVNQETGELDLGSSLHDALTELSGRLPVADNFFGQNAVVDSGVGETLEVGQRLAIERAP